MTAEQIIEKFQLYVDDTTELSSAEELDLLNKVYQKVSDEKLWEILKVEVTGTMTTTTTITLPIRFVHLVENYNYTDNAVSTEINAKPVVVFINNDAKQVVNWSDRKQYANNNNVCYVDMRSSVIRFPVAQASGATYSFDYKEFPANLTLSDTPVFPERFQHILFLGMCIDDMAIQLFDKARSYADQHKAQYDSYLRDMALWNANLQNY